ncbi:HAAS signaling domain-containing protein [Halobacillus trueperi]|uniref:HAAS signaling domain-containing protein n=1 Tax=Halobacillus trueperi TaxID=156205 RepID=UPI003736DFBF
MKWIDVYLQEVGRRLPEKNREDILLEIRSTIEDMLPEDPTEKEVKDVLQELGDPVTLAHGYSEKPMHLIGPRYYDTYISLIKMILPIAITISLITLVAENIIGSVEEGSLITMILTIIGEGIWRVISVGMQVFFWITIIFAIIERLDLDMEDEYLGLQRKKWTPEDLKKVADVPKKRAISQWEVYGAFIWTAIWGTVYFHADHLLGIYENQGEGLTFITPALNQDVLLSYWPGVVLVIGLEIALALYKLLKKEWSKGVVWFHTIQELLSIGIFVWIITDERLFQPAFISYISDLFGVSAAQVENGLAWRIAAIFIIFAVWNIIDGWMKYKKGVKKTKLTHEFVK